ncbi:hypothetical protein EU803_07440 [Loktanella sp. IMCC34160]|uniref:hypothetical protein n=1 Tax=Loktanella sp. IMCC34160 TaxID=2510646 RepID=UPI00101C00C4|nr:hypothetical protein [Loktanella sp. IMCC34160]RYG92262.1 hypothetical protein EU803_07440 [Loktanella sp. IMCC34160]
MTPQRANFLKTANWMRHLALGLLLAAAPFGMVAGPGGPSFFSMTAQAATPAKGGVQHSKDEIDDEEDDDDSGRGRGRGRGRGGDDDREDEDDIDDDDAAPTSPNPNTDGTTTQNGSDDVLRVEVLSNGIIVHFTDGSREQIINGVYSRISPSGMTLQTHRASGADIVRIRTLAAGHRSQAPTSAPPAHPVRIVLGRNYVSVEYSNGWTEVVENGQYRMVDSFGAAILARPAGQADLDRLRALAGQ